jgi:methylated-DNA-protein-cysteine methyltransferase-like protein
MMQPPISHEEAVLLGARIYALVRACPRGRVTTYGWIAAALGYKGGSGARVVGWYLNELAGHSDVPAQRVINSKGELSGAWAFGQKGRMRQLLEQEGVAFTEAGRVDLKRYGWDPSRELSAKERERLILGADSNGVNVGENLMHLLHDDPASPFRIRPVEAE